VNTPKSKAQQQIEAIERRLAAGQISHGEAAVQINQVRREQYRQAYRAWLDSAQERPRPEPLEGAEAMPLAGDVPLVRPFVGRPAARGRASVHRPARMVLVGQLNTVGLLIAEMVQRFRVSDVSDPQPARGGRDVRVTATIAPHFYLTTPREGGHR
jgi:hypothetical protein